MARHIAYHGTTFGALSINGIPAIRTPFEPLVPEVRHVSNTNRYHRPPEETEEEFTRHLLDELEQAILSMGLRPCASCTWSRCRTRAALHAPEGYWRGVREICDRYDILLSADEVITAFGRVGHWFGSERYDIRPDLVTIAKGSLVLVRRDRRCRRDERVMEPFLEQTSMFSHGITFGGHPVMCAIALKNIEIMKREGIVEHVRRARTPSARPSRSSSTSDRRRPARDRVLLRARARQGQGRARPSRTRCEKLLRGFLSNALFEAGLVCRADDRGDP